MRQYQQLLRDVLAMGKDKDDRTGTGTRSLFGYQMRFELSAGFPLVTTKKTHLKSIIHELLWLISGDTNVKYLQDNGVRIWDEWSSPEGELGPVYGKQWTAWTGAPHLDRAGDFLAQPTIDQIAELITGLKENPNSRRHIVSAWNVSDLPNMALPPCHCFFQCHVANGELSLQIYQRSADCFLGLPFNIASYALLTMMLAKVCNLKPGALIWTGGDVHIYHNHLEQVQLQLTRTPYDLPKMFIKDRGQGIDDFLFEDFVLEGYECHPHIAGKVAV